MSNPVKLILLICCCCALACSNKNFIDPDKKDDVDNNDNNNNINNPSDITNQLKEAWYVTSKSIHITYSSSASPAIINTLRKMIDKQDIFKKNTILTFDNKSNFSITFYFDEKEATGQYIIKNNKITFTITGGAILSNELLGDYSLNNNSLTVDIHKEEFAKYLKYENSDAQTAFQNYVESIDMQYHFTRTPYTVANLITGTYTGKVFFNLLPPIDNFTATINETSERMITLTLDKFNVHNQEIELKEISLPVQQGEGFVSITTRNMHIITTQGMKCMINITGQAFDTNLRMEISLKTPGIAAPILLRFEC